MQKQHTLCRELINVVKCAACFITELHRGKLIGETMIGYEHVILPSGQNSHYTIDEDHFMQMSIHSNRCTSFHHYVKANVPHPSPVSCLLHFANLPTFASEIQFVFTS